MDPRLCYRREVVPEERNAFGPFFRATRRAVAFNRLSLEGVPPGEILEATSYSRRWTGSLSDERPKKILEAWEGKNRETLGLLEEALRRPRFQSPEVDRANPPEDVFSLLGLKTLTQLKFLRCRRLASEGKFDRAADEVAGVVTLGEDLVKAEGSLIGYSIGLGGLFQGDEGIRWLACQKGIPETTLKGLLRRLSKPALRPEDEETALKAEYWAFVYLLDSLAGKIEARGVSEENFRRMSAEAEKKGGPGITDEEMALLRPFLESPPLMIDVDETMSCLNDFYLCWLENVRRPWKDADFRRAKKITDRYDAWQKEQKRLYRTVEQAIETLRKADKITIEEKKAFLRTLFEALRNPVGREFLGLAFPSAIRFRILRDNARSDRAATVAILAIRIYETRKGTLPSSLQDLVREGILPEVPRDGFSGESLFYSREKRMLWSPGQNLRPEPVPAPPAIPERGFSRDMQSAWSF